MKSVFIFMFTALGAFSLIGCNTVDGVGEDLENAGDSIQDSAN